MVFIVLLSRRLLIVVGKLCLCAFFVGFLKLHHNLCHDAFLMALSNKQTNRN